MPELIQGLLSAHRGMDGGTHPSLLADGFIANGVNITVRDGRPKTRPGFSRVDVAPPQGVFQGSGRWSLNSGDRLVAVISGHVVSVDLDAVTVTDLGELLDTSAQCFFQQADRFLVIQDGFSEPVILEDVAGVPHRYTYPAGTPAGYKMPIGTIGYFAHGRLNMVPNALPGYPDANGGPYFISGDVLFTYDPQSCLTFEDNTYWYMGGAHALPAEMGYVTGMAALRNAASGTGVGSLIVFGRRGAAAFDISIPREQWNTVNISQVLFFEAGTVSPWAIVPINNDLFYRATDGFRFISYTYSQVQGNSGSLSNVPKSHEVREYVGTEDSDYLSRISAAAWDQRILITAQGHDDYQYRALVSLDLAPLYSFQGATAPAYDGIWTGLDFLQVITATPGGESATYIWAAGPTLYKIDNDAVADDGQAIESMVWTRGFNFEQPMMRKQLNYVDVWISDLRGSAEIDVYFRPVGYPYWKLVATRAVMAPVHDKQTRERLRFALDLSDPGCDASTGTQLRNTSELQFAVVWRGHLQLDKLLANADIGREEPPDPCSETEVSAVIVPDASQGIVDLGVYRYRSA